MICVKADCSWPDCLRGNLEECNRMPRYYRGSQQAASFLERWHLAASPFYAWLVMAESIKAIPLWSRRSW